MATRETTLLSVDIENETYHFTLLDGSKWFVDPGDLPTIATWIPTVGIRIQKTNRPSVFELTNIDEDISVRAAKIG
jgi:hypothetical protein